MQVKTKLTRERTREHLFVIIYHIDLYNVIFCLSAYLLRILRVVTLMYDTQHTLLMISFVEIAYALGLSLNLDLLVRRSEPFHQFNTLCTPPANVNVAFFGFRSR